LAIYLYIIELTGYVVLLIVEKVERVEKVEKVERVYYG
jgi:hypothetical protein